MAETIKLTPKQAKTILDFPWGEYGITMEAKSDLYQTETSEWEILVGKPDGEFIDDETLAKVKAFMNLYGYDSGLSVMVSADRSQIAFSPAGRHYQ